MCCNDTFTLVLDTVLWRSFGLFFAKKTRDIVCNNLRTFSKFVTVLSQPTDKNGSGLYDTCCHNVQFCPVC